jgi:RND family efflux transporter MFP subunit
MKGFRHIILKKIGRPVEFWATGLAVAAVALLAVFIMLPGNPDPRAIMGTPHSANAAVSHDDHGNGQKDSGLTGNQAMESDGNTLYACPMMCTAPSDKPGSCPVCGMALTAVGNHDRMAETGPPQLHLSARAVHLAEIQTAPVMRMAAESDVRLFGRIDFDSAHITEITAFMPGVIDRVYIKRAGQFVRWGDPLFDIYSSDLLETQRQLIEAMQYVPSFLAFQANTPHVARDMPVQTRRNSAAGERTDDQEEALQKIAALRHKLSILGLPKRDIDQFMKKGEATGTATVYAPMYGQITVQGATEGTFVNTGTSLFTIADPKYVWARLDAYESDYPWIRRGQQVSFTTEAYPGETFKAKIVYIDPVFNSQTRTFSLGAITTEDQGGRLKSGMLVRAVVHARLDADGHVISGSVTPDRLPLVVPASAAMITGRRAVVYVSVPGDTPVFEGREVVLGPRARNHYVVREGLLEGEQVVVNGNFKIDSAMQISAKPSLMAPLGGTRQTGHDHLGGHAWSATEKPSMTGHPTAPVADGEPSPVDVHQTTSLSDGMHHQYMDERQMSRMDMENFNMMESESDERSYENHKDLNTSRARRQASSYGSRRKPGQYGDTTRQGASMLEEHRKRWRP